MEDLFLVLFLISLVGLIVGLIKPSIFNPITKKETTKKQVGVIFGGALILFFVLFGVVAEPSEKDASDENGDVAQEESSNKEDSKEWTTVKIIKGQQTPKKESEVFTINSNEFRVKYSNSYNGDYSTPLFAIKVANPEGEEIDLDCNPLVNITDSSSLSVSDSKICRATGDFKLIISSTAEADWEAEIEELQEAKESTSTTEPKRVETEKTNNKIKSESEETKEPTEETGEAVETEAEPEATTGERNALSKAKTYLDQMAFSRDGLIEQLKYEGFTHQQAVYGADNVGADWNEQAVRQAKIYLDQMAFSRDGLIEQLKYEGFTHQQAEYGAEGVGY